MSQLNRRDFKEAIIAYLEKVDGPSWNHEYSIEGFKKKIRYSAAVLIFESLDSYLSKVFSIADMISNVNEEDIISVESASAAISNVLKRKRIVIENNQESKSLEKPAVESTSSSSINLP